jgi:Fic family protein
MIYVSPPLSTEDVTVLDAIHRMRRDLDVVLRKPRRWQGVLRRNMLARAIRGSNSIEGYTVAADDAAAALEDEEALDADDATFAEIRGYRQALGYVLSNAADSNFIFDTTAMRAMHYMMLQHDLTKSPGSYRTGTIYVRDDKADLNVYEGPDADLVAELMEELAVSLRAGADLDPLVRGAMAHLNLVMIHPFRDGNGRMARALQTLVIARAAIADPAFCSIEEWLGDNTEDYYRALASTGNGSWQPRTDAHLWLSFNLRAHHMQAQTVARRLSEAADTWQSLDELVTAHRLPDRVTDVLFNAMLGYRIRRSGYIKSTQLDERTASRDLNMLAKAGLLQAQGETRGRHYLAGDPLLKLRLDIRKRRNPITDPYPWMRVALAKAPAPGTPTSSS